MEFRTYSEQQLGNMMHTGDEAVTLEDGTKSNYVTLRFQDGEIKNIVTDNALSRLCWAWDSQERRIDAGKNEWLNNNESAKEAIYNKGGAFHSGRRPRLYIPPVRNPFRRITHPGRNKYAGLKNHGKNKYKKRIKHMVQFFSGLIQMPGNTCIA